MKSRYISIIIALVIINVALAWQVLAGNLDSTNPPGSTSSYGLDDIYKRLASGAASTSSVYAEPSGGPGSTMKTLNEIMAVAPITRTNGATTTQVISGKTFWGLTSGQWGQQTGQRYGGCHCANGTLTGTRWCDNGDGTVTDLLGDSTNNKVGQCLVWLKNANCTDVLATVTGGSMNWDNANVWSSAVKNTSCGLSDGSGDGIWRLPTKEELDGITNGTDQVRSASMQAFTGVQSALYWSSASNATFPTFAWLVYMTSGNVNYTNKTFTYRVWAVRGGQ